MPKAICVVLAIVLFAGIAELGFSSLHAEPYSRDVLLYEAIGSSFGDKGAMIVSGEYPPLASSLFWAVGQQRLISPFRTAWVASILLVIALAMIYACLQLKAIDAVLLVIGILYSVLLLGSEIHFGRYDLFVGILLFLALRSYEFGRFRASGIFLGIATCLKLIPLFAIPILWVLTPRQQRKLFSVGCVIGLCLSFIIPLFIGGFEGTLDTISHMLSFQGSRGIQVETTWSSLHMLYHALLGDLSFIEQRAGGFENTDISRLMLLPSLLLSLGGIAFLLSRLRHQEDVAKSITSPAIFLTFLWLLGWSTVLSPQYFVWIVPVMFAWGIEQLRYAQARRTWTIMFLLSLTLLCLTTQWIFPFQYVALLERQELGNVFVLVLRNCMIFVLAGLLAHRFFVFVPQKQGVIQ
jgi:hypothetical protein